MKIFIVMLALTVTFASLVYAGAVDAGNVVKRQIYQQKRIDAGIASGELTCPEARLLRQEQRQIQRHKRSAQSDCEFKQEECLCLERKQNRANRHIYQMKHNDVRWCPCVNDSSINGH
jgi:hypothetical protein